MIRRFQSGDRVKTKPNTRVDYFSTYDVEYVGTVIDYGINDFILVKFDNFTIGHNGSVYYSRKDINYDPKNRQHLYVREEDLCLL